MHRAVVPVQRHRHAGFHADQCDESTATAEHASAPLKRHAITFDYGVIDADAIRPALARCREALLRAA